MKPPVLSTFQLKERGWTDAMIRDLLGPHDRERRSELRVGRRDRLADDKVKLYLEDRVVQVETTEAFAVAQDRARMRQDSAAKAAETRHANQLAQLARYDALPMPVLQRHSNGDTMTSQQLWEHHLTELYEWQMNHDHLLSGLPTALRREAENQAYKRHREAVDALYGERP
ncbi:hypothetical protein [Deinococcus sp. QL22]|uniref:hypothetical protein n=1 Tax=Deinococcus sp. QL22 TaxID=2939437 RepID=UPI00201767BC|nr:hypothetical protein [Deinococcus sp. QL22]UQN10728.1 hypothetical protein M1R55_31330 [Deinococcus sp. QL22]UQN10773.1 hypothetical protein M1R55_31075 [Deinococcus sp. QL22]